MSINTLTATDKAIHATGQALVDAIDEAVDKNYTPERLEALAALWEALQAQIRAAQAIKRAEEIRLARD